MADGQKGQRPRPHIPPNDAEKAWREERAAEQACVTDREIPGEPS